MISWWFLFASLALGWWLVRLLHIPWRWWVQAALAVPVGILAVSWFSFGVALVTRSTNLAITLTNLILVIPVGIMVRVVWTTYRRDEKFLSRVLTIGALVIPIIILFWLHAPYSNSTGGLNINGYSWGDIPLHMTLASFFAHQPYPFLSLPLLPHTALTYPFLIDWHAGILVNLGADWTTALALPGAALFLAACVLSVELVRRLIGVTRAALIHMGLFLGLGSAAGLLVLAGDILSRHAIWTTDYSNTGSLNLANPITSHFLPQRSFLFGFACVMALLVIIYDLWKKEQWKKLVWPTLGLGLLFFVHVHTALVGSAWWLAVAGYTAWKEPRSRRWLAIAVGVFLIVALPQLWWLFTRLPAHFVTAHVGWMWDGTGNLLVYWLRQLGLLVPLILIGIWLFRKQYQNPFLVAGLLGGAALFILGNMFLFQPSPFDNLKFLFYSFWILLLPAAWALERLWKTKLYIFAWIIFGLCTVVGLHTVIRDVTSVTSYETFTNDDIQAAADLQDILPTDAVVAVSPRHNNMIAALVGRRILVGYDGWLWSYGLNYGPVKADNNTLLHGQDDGSIAAQYGVDYIAVHPRDAADGTADLVALANDYTIVYSGHSWVVYRTH